MFDGCARNVLIKAFQLTDTQEAIEKEAAIQKLLRSDSVQCFLDHHSGRLIFPDRTTSRLTAFTHNNVAEPKPVTIHFFRLEAHGSQVGECELPPANVYVCKIGKRHSSILVLVK